MKITAKFGGAQQIRDAFGYVQKAMEGALEDIAWAGALPIMNEARALAPVKTGNLRRSIHIETTEKSPTRVVASVGPHVDYAIYLEYGTRRMHARPFLRPAFDGKQKEAQQAMADAAKQFITEALDSAYSSRR
jgi:phage protein, HK97 gp10 family